MRANRSKDTRPEETLRQGLRAAGCRGYRANVSSLPGLPDVVFMQARIAVFVHGCYWHRCAYCDPPVPKTNARYWRAKFTYNKERDKGNSRRLRELGFRVVTVWECQLRNAPDRTLARVVAAVKERLGDVRGGPR